MRSSLWARSISPLRVLILSLLVLVSSVNAQDTILRVDPSRVLGPINPSVYGVNYGPWAPLSVKTMPMAFDLQMTFMRFPAGNWGDQFDLRPSDIDVFIGLAKQMGAEPSISVRLEGGTAEKAAELVRYTNVKKGYGVKYWSIGNEPDLYDGYTAERASEEWREFALAMEAVDPTILLMGPEVSQYPPTEAGDEYTNVRREWVRTFLEMNGDLVDVVTIHRYPFPRNNVDSTTAEAMMANPPEWDVMIPNLRAIIQETTGRDIPIGVTEINSHWSDSIGGVATNESFLNSIWWADVGGVATNESFLNSIWWADVLGGLIRQQVDIVNYFNLRTTSSPSSYGLLGRDEPHPTYYVYQMYKQFGTELIASETNDSLVSVTASLTEEGNLTVMVVNRSDTPKAVSLEIAGGGFAGEAETWLMDETNHAAAVDPTAFSDTTALELPAYSVTLYRLSPAN
jgi:hypothetical protein